MTGLTLILFEFYWRSVFMVTFDKRYNKLEANVLNIISFLSVCIHYLFKAAWRDCNCDVHYPSFI